MESPKTLRRPANWQDFESLCKELWGEIWKYPEIQKNGRLGQKQSGVDIFGIPSGENGYYGIQCKGKDEYTFAQFTIKELEEEINKAKEFKPALKKLYFATTAVNDVKIQEYVREKNIEHISQKLFEVHLYSWESIVDLIDRNRGTYDYYVRNQNYKTDKQIEVSFDNDQKEITVNSYFAKYIERPNSRKIFENDLDDRESIFSYSNLRPFIPSPEMPKDKINLSFFPIHLHIKNKGKDPIEDYKLVVDLVGNITEITDTNQIGLFSFRSKTTNSIFSFHNRNRIEVIPSKGILVSEDVLGTEPIFIKPSPEETSIQLKWKLISKDYKDEGTLVIIVKSNIKTIERDYNLIKADSGNIYTGGIEDLIIEEE